MKEICVEEKKKILLDVLDSIAAFCESHGLIYLLSYGSLLGAVRHKGFIPWDDDIDIIMPRPDYEKFLSTFESEGFAVASYRDRRFFPMYFAKVYAKKTYSILNDTIQLGYGVSVDIFPLDGIPSDDDESSKLWSRYRKIEKVYLRCQYYETLPRTRTVKNVLQRLYKWIFNTRRCAERMEKLLMAHPYEKAEYAGNFMTALGLEKLPKSLYQETADYPFGDRVYKGPADYDALLTVLYGADYMTPPPESARESLHSEKFYYCE